MPSVQPAPLPRGSLLEPYAAAGAYTDCYAGELRGSATLQEFIAAFYTTRVFKLERWLLSSLLRHPSTDHEAALLAHGELSHFSAWSVEARDSRQALLAAGRTRSWLMVSPGRSGSESTALFFGSAVVPRRRGGLGWQFSALLGFHKLYSRILLAAAIRRLAKGRPYAHARGDA